MRHRLLHLGCAGHCCRVPPTEAPRCRQARGQVSRLRHPARHAHPEAWQGVHGMATVLWRPRPDVSARHLTSHLAGVTARRTFIKSSLISRRRAPESRHREELMCKTDCRPQSSPGTGAGWRLRTPGRTLTEQESATRNATAMIHQRVFRQRALDDAGHRWRFVARNGCGRGAARREARCLDSDIRRGTPAQRRGGEFMAWRRFSGDRVRMSPRDT